MLRSTRALLRTHRYLARSNTWKHPIALSNRTSLTATRSLSSATPLRTAETAAPVQNIKLQRPITTSEILEALAAFGNDPNGAVHYFQNIQKSQGQNALSAETYIALIRLVRGSKDPILRGTVCKWFYSSRGKSLLKKNITNNLNVWNEALKLGMLQAPVAHATDLSMVVAQFRKSFDLETIQDTEILGLLMRSYGIMNRPDEVASLLDLARKRADNNETVEAAVLAYASCDANAQVDRLMATLDKPSESVVKALARSYAFSGDVARTSKYCSADDGLIFLAYKGAIGEEYERQIRDGLALYSKVKFQWNNELEALNEAFEKDLTQKFLDKESGIDVVQCNFILGYLFKAHVMNPKKYPIARVEKFVREEMPARGVNPNGWTYNMLLKAYGQTQEFQDYGHTNTRLDKALNLFKELQHIEGLQVELRPLFQSLFRACIPHQGDRYPYDYFLYSSGQNRSPMHLDKRFFDIEKIMLDNRIRYDKQSYIFALTCLAASGLYKAMWNRWRLIKQSGFRRDNLMYRHVLALASMDREQAQYALSVVKEELTRELPKENVGWKTYTAMLDCCIAAQDPETAKQIFATMRESGPKKPESLSYYRPMLRAATRIKGLESEATELFEEIDRKDIPYDSIVWRSAVHRTVSEGGDSRGQKLHQLFTKYTMDRFQRTGKIPIPIRERAPVVPFPSAPYSSLDIHMIDMFIASLVDSQDVSLALDVFKTLKEQQPGKLRISRKSVNGFVQLAKREKSDEDLTWLLE